jgi:hypothetical protein
MTIELKTKSLKGKITLSPLSEQIKLITNRCFELPLIDRQGDTIRFVYKEKSEYKVLSSGVQFCANGEKYSGDTFSTFEDGKGLFYAVIWIRLLLCGFRYLVLGGLVIAPPK